MDPASLLDLFGDTADAVRAAVGALSPDARRGPGERPTQYALDLVADAAALDVLGAAPVRVVSEESGVGGDPGAEVTVVMDPVDGSTNCSRGIPYWSISLAAVGPDGLMAGYVRNQVTGETFTATRGAGSELDGEPVTTSRVEDPAEAIVALVASQRVAPGSWAQTRSLGSAALELCEVAAGRLDAFVARRAQLAPWDYLAGLLICEEAGAIAEECDGEDLVTTDFRARRQPLVAGTRALLEAVRSATA